MLSLPWNHGKAVLPFHLCFSSFTWDLRQGSRLHLDMSWKKEGVMKWNPFWRGIKQYKDIVILRDSPKKKGIVWVGNTMIPDKKKERKLFFVWKYVSENSKNWMQVPSPISSKKIVCVFNYMDVSKNRGTPKSSILIGFSIINHPFWGTIIFGNIHISNSKKMVWFFNHPQGLPSNFFQRRVGCFGEASQPSILRVYQIELWTNETRKKPWLVGLYRGLYYPVI